MSTTTITPESAEHTGTGLQPAVLAAPEAAEYIGTTAGTLAQWRHRGQGPVFLRMGRAVRYRRVDLDAYLETLVAETMAEMHRD